MPEIIATTQAPNYGARVKLFVLDASALGGSVFHFATGSFGGEPIVFDGEPYAPVPCQVEGVSWSGEGAIPTPTLKASNIAGQFVTSVLGTNGLAGARLTIIETFDQFLDNGANPDPLARFPSEEFYIDQLESMDNERISWRLSALFDVRGVKLPRRQVLRDACTHRYRRYIDGEFDYSKATCPYVGEGSFDVQNEVTADSGDQCGKNLSACKIRFGENASLPFRGFPGVARVRNRV